MKKTIAAFRAAIAIGFAAAGLATMWLLHPGPLAAQQPASGRGTTATRYPAHPPADPAVVARGKTLYGVNCQFCHGSDARGGEGGPNLVRSEIVLADQKGELIGEVVLDGRSNEGMPKFNMTAAQISDIAAFLHSFENYRTIVQPPLSILVGDAKAGKSYFDSKCASCHSPTGDLNGIATRIPDPKALQNRLVAGGGGAGRASKTAPIIVTVTLSSGTKAEGKLLRIDDFIVALATADGTQRTFVRNGDTPKVELNDPLKGHRDLFTVYTDIDIHNLTAYLETLK